MCCRIYQCPVRLVVKMRFLTGIARSIAEVNGKIASAGARRA